MKTLIINNISVVPIKPPFSTSYLCGLLKGGGSDCKQIDAGLEVWDWLLSPGYLSKRQFKPGNLAHSGGHYCPSITGKEFDALQKWVVNNIEIAKKVLKTKPAFFDIEMLNWAFETIFMAQQLIYYHYGTLLSYRVDSWPYIGTSRNSLSRVYQLAGDRNLNPLVEAIEEKIIPKIAEIRPGVIFVDIAWPGDVIQVVTLNKTIKKYFPSIHINFPGQGFDEFSFSRLRKRLKTDKRLFLGFDSVFVYRNDYELPGLTEKLENEKLDNIENFAYIQGEQIRLNTPFNKKNCFLEKVLPDYSDLPLEKYLSPELIFVDRLTYCCYWAKCHYCSINSNKDSYKEFDLESVINKLEYYRKTYGCNHIIFMDEACKPEFAEKFTAEIIAGDIDIIWALRTRVDEGFTRHRLERMHRAGCRELYIGLETVAAEILEKMNKTGKPGKYGATAAKIMKNCSDIGIGIHFCLILGFPGEKRTHRKELIEFFKENIHWSEKMPLFVNFNRFGLMPDSYIYSHPEAFNISGVSRNPGHFNMTHVPFNEAGTDNDDINQCIEELISIFVTDESMRPSWFNISESPYELLFNEYCSVHPGNLFLLDKKEKRM